MSSALRVPLENALSEAVPLNSLALYLDICDIVNETEDGHTEAMKIIRKKITSKPSPAVLLRIVAVLSVLVKNGHHRFHVLVAAPDFVAILTKLVDQADQPAIVRDRILLLLQEWADSFEGVAQLEAVPAAVAALRQRGVEFPAQNLEELAPIHTPPASAFTGRPAQHPPQQHAHGSTSAPSHASGPAPAAGHGPGRTVPMRLVELQPNQKIHADVRQQAKLRADLATARAHAARLAAGPADPALRAVCLLMRERAVALTEHLASEDLLGEVLDVTDALNAALSPAATPASTLLASSHAAAAWPSAALYEPPGTAAAALYSPPAATSHPHMPPLDPALVAPSSASAPAPPYPTASLYPPTAAYYPPQSASAYGAQYPSSSTFPHTLAPTASAQPFSAASPYPSSYPSPWPAPSAPPTFTAGGQHQQGPGAVVQLDSRLTESTDTDDFDMFANTRHMYAQHVAAPSLYNAAPPTQASLGAALFQPSSGQSLPTAELSLSPFTAPAPSSVFDAPTPVLAPTSIHAAPAPAFSSIPSSAPTLVPTPAFATAPATLPAALPAEIPAAAASPPSPSAAAAAELVYAPPPSLHRPSAPAAAPAVHDKMEAAHDELFEL